MSDLYKAREMNEQRKKRGVRRRLNACVAVLVAFCTVYSLISPAITLEAQSASCGLEEHIHTSDCYTLACGKVERFSHTHTDDCYTGGVLTCTLTEQTLHHHSDSCYSQPEPACGLTECEAHTHTEECYTDGTLTCTLDETAGHTHASDCYPADFTAELVCGQEDLPEHRHTEDCYALACELEEHTHTDACYSTAEAYALSMTEGVAEETTEETTEAAAELATEETVEEKTEEATEQAAEETAEQATEEATEAHAEEATASTAEGLLQLTGDELYNALLAIPYDERIELMDSDALYDYIPTQLTEEQLAALAATSEINPATQGDLTKHQSDYTLDPVEYDPSVPAFSVGFDVKFSLGKSDFYDSATGTYTYEWAYEFDQSVNVSNLVSGGPYEFEDEKGVKAGTYTFQYDETTGKYKIVLKFDKTYMQSAGDTITGYYKFTASVDEDNYKDGDLVIPKSEGSEITVDGDDITWPEGQKVNYDVTTSKSAGTIDTTNNTLTYTVTVSSTKGTPDPLTLTDVIQSTDTSTFKIESLDSVSIKKVDSSNWNWSTSDLSSSDYSYTLDKSSGTATYILPGLSAKQSYTITYTYSFSGVDSGSSAVVNNEVTATAKDSTGEEVEYDTDIDVTVNKGMDGSKSGTYDKASKTITWTVKINSNKQNLNGYVLTDTMLKEAASDSITVSPSGDVYTVDQTNGTITFNSNTYDTYTITYTTPVTSTSVKTEKVENSATLEKDGTSINIGPVGVDVGGATGDKEFVDATVDETTNTATVNWKVTIYVNGTGLAKGTTITDSFSEASTDQYMTGTQLSNFWGQSNGTGIVAYDSNGNKIKTFKYNSDNNIFDVIFVTTDGDEIDEYKGKDMRNNDYSSFSFTLNDEMTFDTNVAYLRMTYSTTVDLSNATEGANTYTNQLRGSFWDDATYTYYKKGVTKTGKDTDGTYTEDKSSIENSDGTLTWQVEVDVDANSNGTAKYPSLTITDTLPTGVTLTGLSVSGQYGNAALTISDDGTVSGSSNSYNFTGTYTEGVITLTVAAKNSSNLPTGIMYLTVTCTVDNAATTAVGADPISFTNSVSVTTDEGDFGSDTQTQEWTKTEEEDKTEVLTKTGSYDHNPETLNYTVYINPTGKDLDATSDTVTVTDVIDYTRTGTYNKIAYTLELDLIYSSLTFYRATYDAATGSWTKGAALSSSEWTFDSYTKEANSTHPGNYLCTIVARVPDETPLIMEYKYKVSGENLTGIEMWLDNTVSVTGGGSKKNSNLNGTKWEKSETSAGVTTKTYTLIKRVEGSLNETIEGAGFTVYSYDESTGSYKEFKTGLETDENGQIVIQFSDGYEYNRAYYIQEVSAPSGYILYNPTRYYFHFSNSDTTTYPQYYSTDFPSDAVDIASGQSEEPVINKVERKYTITKVDSDTQKAITGSTAEFALYKYVNGAWTKQEQVFSTSVESGQIVIHWQNSTGDYEFEANTGYYLKETKAPDGYDLPTTETLYYFWFYDEDSSVANYPAGFGQYYDAVDLFSTSTKTDTSETVSNTKQKTYTLTKYDGSTNETLSGVVFELRKVTGTNTYETLGTFTTDANGQIQIPVTSTTTNSGTTGTITTSEGTVITLADYTPYYLVEKQAPDGYITDSSTKYYFYYGNEPTDKKPSDWDTVSPAPVNLKEKSGTAEAYNYKTSITVNKTWLDSSGNEITDTSSMPEVSFSLYRRDSTEEFSTHGTSSGNANAVTVSYTDYSNNVQDTLYGNVGDSFQVTRSDNGYIYLKVTPPGSTSFTEVSNNGNGSVSVSLDLKGTYTIEIYTFSSIGVDTPTIKAGSSSTSSGYSAIEVNSATDTLVGTYQLNAGNSFTQTIDNLDYGYTASDGTPHYYGYYVVETTTGYTTTYDFEKPASDGTLTISNVSDGSTSTTTSLSVSKVWQDADGSETTALAESVTIVLHQVDSVESTDIVKETITLNASNNWTWSSNTLPATVTDSGGNKTHDYTYYVVETVPEGATYTASYTVNDGAGTGTSADATANGSFTITNTLKPVETTLRVEKEWDGLGSLEYTEVKFKVFRKAWDHQPTDAELEALTTLNVAYDSEIFPTGVELVVERAVTLSTNWVWDSTTDTTLTLYSYKDGVYYTYFIAEKSDAGYTAAYSPTAEVTGGSTITVTNTTTEKDTTLTVKKQWLDSEDEDITADRVNDVIYFTITQTPTVDEKVGTPVTLTNPRPITGQNNTYFSLSRTTFPAWTWSSEDVTDLDLPYQVYDATTGEVTTYSYSIVEVEDPRQTEYAWQQSEGTLTGKGSNVALELVNKLNPAEYTLPMTGGSGTTAFYIVGTALTLGAFLLLIKKRRMA